LVSRLGVVVLDFWLVFFGAGPSVCRPRQK